MPHGYVGDRHGARCQSRAGAEFMKGAPHSGHARPKGRTLPCAHVGEGRPCALSRVWGPRLLKKQGVLGTEPLAAWNWGSEASQCRCIQGAGAMAYVWSRSPVLGLLGAGWDPGPCLQWGGFLVLPAVTCGPSPCVLCSVLMSFLAQRPGWTRLQGRQPLWAAIPGGVLVPGVGLGGHFLLLGMPDLDLMEGVTRSPSRGPSCAFSPEAPRTPGSASAPLLGGPHGQWVPVCGNASRLCKQP